MDKMSQLAFQRAKLARLPREYPSILVAYALSLPADDYETPASLTNTGDNKQRYNIIPNL